MNRKLQVACILLFSSIAFTNDAFGQAATTYSQNFGQTFPTNQGLITVKMLQQVVVMTTRTVNWVTITYGQVTYVDGREYPLASGAAITPLGGGRPFYDWSTTVNKIPSGTYLY